VAQSNDGMVESAVDAPRNLTPARVRRGPNVLASVGRTPLLELPRLAARIGVPSGSRLLAKAEQLNPGGSVKDRLAEALLDDAEAHGLRPGGTIVEATSGNTGISLAIAAAVRGYHLEVVSSTKVSDEKIRLLRTLGADVTVTPNVAHGDPAHYLEVARRRAEELPGAVYLDQFRSTANAGVHEGTTGPELLRQAVAIGGRLDAFVAGVGTGGTLVGIARYLRRASPSTRIVLADPEGSVLAHGGPFRAYQVEGIGDDTVPPLLDRSVVDASVVVPDRTSFRVALLAARTEGLLVGGSSGTHLAAAAEVARGLPEGSVVATLLPDSGRNYLSKFLDPAWCDTHGFPGLHEEVRA
jgi:cystathionine beta-synthase